MPNPRKRLTFQEQLQANHIPPGPKMKDRPPDFDEELVRKAPTFIKWESLQEGEPLTYASRTFVKGHANDEERLMRRIMIARRNNLKDHSALKKARALEADRVRSEMGVVATATNEPSSAVDTNDELKLLQHTASLESVLHLNTNPSGTKRRFIPGKLRPDDNEIKMEMDIPAVEATRSYRKWLSLAEGEKMTYNQEYVKGDPEADWLLRKNIWRRMRYRRENVQKVREMQGDVMKESIGMDEAISSQVQSVVDAAVAAAAAAHAESSDTSFDAMAVADLDAGGVNDPLVSSALDAAAQLAAAVMPQHHELMNDDNDKGEDDVHI